MKSHHKSHPSKSPEPKPKEPQFMVQVHDTKVLRKDILESLKDVIIFMQGYEKFRKIQEEKVLRINELKASVKELHNFIDNKLRRVLPKGKLDAIDPQKPERRQELRVEQRPASVMDYHVEEHEEHDEALDGDFGELRMPSEAKAAPIQRSQPIAVAAPFSTPKTSAASELDALEAQLKEIERQLKDMN